MPNSNYQAGVRFERERMNHYKTALGHDVMRTAGSHGLFDVITISKGGDIQLLQCKVVSTQAEANRLIKAFKANPPLGQRERARYHQVLAVKVRGKGIEEAFI